MPSDSEQWYADERVRMVRLQVEARGITAAGVLDAMLKVERHRFVSVDQAQIAYEDRPLAIGPKQTISQPYIVALMLQELELKKTERVLEIGTGSGYQTALLAELVKEVYTIELEAILASAAERLLGEIGYDNIYFRIGDGFAGWPENSPFDKIIVSAAPAEIPRELIKQLKEYGIIILPLGVGVQQLISVRKTKRGLKTMDLGKVRFVEMIHPDE